jgi:hypothetical protein
MHSGLKEENPNGASSNGLITQNLLLKERENKNSMGPKNSVDSYINSTNSN